MLDNLIGKKIKISYWKYTGSLKTENYFIGILLKEETEFIILKAFDGRENGFAKKDLITWKEVMQ